MRPCAGYKYRVRAGTEIPVGFDAVGPGWHKILEKLDQDFIRILGRQDSSKLRVLQIKEKFGALRVYVDVGEFSDKKRCQIYEDIGRAEAKSMETCEVCGQRGTQGGKYWTKTFCPEHHREREETGKNPLEKFWRERDERKRAEQEAEGSATDDPGPIPDLQGGARRRG